MPTRYAAYEWMLSTARPQNAAWRPIAGLILVFLVTVLTSLAGGLAMFAFGVFDGAGNLELLILDSAGTLAVLFLFGGLTLATFGVAYLLHGRLFQSLCGPYRAASRDFLRALKWLIIVVALMLLVPMPGEVTLTRVMEPRIWIGLIPTALAAIFVQTSAEEVLFRGYLQTQLAARFSSPLLWMLPPAVIFGMLHYDPQTMGENASYVVIWATLFGLAAGDLTARAGNIGPAVAFHFVNNFSAMMIVAAPGPLSGLALYHLPFEASDPALFDNMMVLELANLLLLWLACRVAIRR